LCSRFSVAEYTTPPARSILSQAFRKSRVERLKRDRFQTAIPATSPLSTISIALFQSGRLLSPPEASALRTSTTSGPRAWRRPRSAPAGAVAR
jgi:hypothetical protein